MHANSEANEVLVVKLIIATSYIFSSLIMAMSKTMLGVFIGVLVIFSIFSQNANAETISMEEKEVYNESLNQIGYPSIGGDRPNCKENPGACKPRAENPYNRGCEPIDRCHNATI